MVCSIQMIPVSGDPDDVYTGKTFIEAIKNCLDCIASVDDEEWRDAWLAQTLAGLAECAEKIADGATFHRYRFTDMNPHYSFDMLVNIMEDDDDQAGAGEAAEPDA